MSTTSTVEVTTVLREHIMSGQIHPGEKLQQQRLAQALGVSRTPLRSALTNLAQEGLVQYEPNRGYTVRAFSRKDVVDGYASRAVLEGLAAATVARQGLADATLDELTRLLEVGDRVLSKGRLDPDDLGDYRAMNVNFHNRVIAEARNRWVEDLVRQTQLIPFASNRMIVWKDYAVIVRSHDDHHRLLDAIGQRDAGRADFLLREHINFAGEYLARHIEKGK
ncbi:GntR family transcriptional regulator [Halomonas icarae]|uniref:GntR family transcriptional regulator n=1 Tax=Halomonas icarae TaxID=2691040 RepID=A0A7X5AMA0_9GAMM|nr:GntR family transcriptional regulator [Halomonas icarae]MDR5903001.1 GntR family transcriptional regulator [Halomonas icarae]NAW13576.1 GntR family transcriptional regulator [Halomonas icarae]